MPGPPPFPERVDPCSYPGVVPRLVDTRSGVTLRALAPVDLPAVVEQCRDPDSIRWTTVPVPVGGYGLADAEEWLGMVREGWHDGTSLVWAIVADRGSPSAPRCCGSIELRTLGEGLAEVGFGLHPAARGRSVMSSAVRLVCDYGLDGLGLRALRWQAHVGNWPSRRVAAAAGFRFDGTVRRLLPHRGELRDAWVATLTAEDPRTPRPWRDPPVLVAEHLRLRPFAEADVSRVVTACTDPRTRHWLVSLPNPYDAAAANAFVEATREQAAAGRALVWCVADRGDDRCLGSLSLDGFGGYARRLEVGYWTHPEARGRGLMTEAVRCLTAYAEAEQLADSIAIRCAAPNAASRHVATAAGYVEFGVLPASEPIGDGTIVDLVTYARPG